ncbi:MAG: prephenate dehydratase [Candidatus Sumerlaeaceae bacterium]|nr:prephenate dehydratase [Candidatus Sumerlaeaceae bacterium]
MTGKQPKKLTLDELRAQIDELDHELVRLLDKRAEVARRIGEAKLTEGKQRFFDASRQKKVLQSALDASNGEFPGESLRNVFVEIMSGCLAREKPPTVGYLGPEATYSHLASMSEFGNSADLRPFNSILDVFIATDREWIDYGVVPIENSTGGVIHSTLDMFLDYDLRICSEIFLRIHQNLISRNPMERIKTIYSKAEPFQQCQIWLRENLPNVQLIEVSATARGVEMSKDRDYAAAIGPALAARKYNVPILAANIEDMKDNTTRFLVISKQDSPRTGKDKTSVMISIKDKPGALFDLLKPFQARGINLTKIESRPTRRKAWDLVFFVDLEGHVADKPIAEALEEVRKAAKSFKIMGSYPRDIKITERMERLEQTAGDIF